MKNLIAYTVLGLLLSGCVSLTHQENNTLRSLRAQGITTEKPAGNWEKPASAAGAGLLNLLPGGGNFYLASGNGADNGQMLYGFLNLLTWPISVVWGIPQAAVDAGRINERELIYYYTFDEGGKEALREQGYEVTAGGRLEKVQTKSK